SLRKSGSFTTHYSSADLENFRNAHFRVGANPEFDPPRSLRILLLVRIENRTRRGQAVGGQITREPCPIESDRRQSEHIAQGRARARLGKLHVAKVRVRRGSLLGPIRRSMPLDADLADRVAVLRRSEDMHVARK